jgi:hypothetical protein
VYVAYAHDGMAYKPDTNSKGTRPAYHYEISTGTYPYAIRKFTADGKPLARWTFRESIWPKQTKRAEFIFAMTVAPDGCLYAVGLSQYRYLNPGLQAMPDNWRETGCNCSEIYKYSPTGKLLARWPLYTLVKGNVVANMCGDLAVDRTGALFSSEIEVTNNGSYFLAIRRLVPSGQTLLDIQPPISPSRPVNYSSSAYLALDQHGNLYTTNPAEPFIRKYSPTP